jgi:hypothetical protein
MDTDQKRVLTWLLAWCAATVASPVMELYRGDWFSFVILIGGFLLFPLSFVALTLSVWQFVRTGRLSRMEAWWWLSTPYSAALPLVIVSLRLRDVVNVHSFGPYLLVWLVTGLSSAGWTLVIVFRVSVFPSEKFTTTKKVMLAVALLVPLVVFVFFR